MKTFWLRSELWLPQSRGEIFQFFADPHNLDTLTPAWLQFKILSPADTAMGKGTLLDYRLRLHGVPIRWQSEISLWEPPRPFCRSANQRTLFAMGARAYLRNPRRRHFGRRQR
jgi:ligand-binding SRPBCC domain-containing protein